jgi:hypothetical protein
MSALQAATNALHDLKAVLLASRPGELDPALVAGRVNEILRLLSGDEAGWIGTTEAKRLLGVGSENTVKAWARLGLLRSRQLPNGRIQVLVDDVLRRRAEHEALLGIGGDELTPEELQSLNEERPGTNPWERAPADQPR